MTPHERQLYRARHDRQNTAFELLKSTNPLEFASAQVETHDRVKALIDLDPSVEQLPSKTDKRMDYLVKVFDIRAEGLLRLVVDPKTQEAFSVALEQLRDWIWGQWSELPLYMMPPIGHEWRRQIERITPRMKHWTVEGYRKIASQHNVAKDDSTTAALHASSRRFAISLSFPGEIRQTVEAIANILAGEIGYERVLYDRFIEAELARPNLDTYLTDLYEFQSDLLVAFLGTDYQNKEWCGLEARRIRNLIKTRQDDRIMLLRYDDTAVPGFLGIDGFLNIREKSEKEISTLVLQRHSQLLARDVKSSDRPTARINKLSATLTSSSHPLSLGSRARELLAEASRDRVGAIMSILLADGTHVQTNGREFVEPNDLRSAAQWRAAVTELQRSGLIEDRAGEKKLFFLTDEGYKVADLPLEE